MKLNLNLTQKIIKNHLIKKKYVPSPGEEIALKVDQTLTQDATGTIVYLQYENIVADRKDKKVKVPISVSYVDHNTLQPTFENSDDHKYLQTVASRYGIIFSPAGNGICHQLHLENFASPGKILIGSDSHTPTSSAVGMLAIGVGGLEIASVLAGYPLYLHMPEIVNIVLTGELQKSVSAKDIILFLLKKFTVKGGINKIFEYTGDGIKNLSVYDRATITNMGTELGLTSSIFPSDKITEKFLSMYNRKKDFVTILPDKNCSYDGKYNIDLTKIEPMVALPHSPDNVVPVKEIEGLPVDQVCIGSCTNSSLKDMILLCKMLEGIRINPNVSVVVNIGSRQIILLLEKMGLMKNLYLAGVRVLEPVCGPCIGQGQAPITSGVSVRTYNRNFESRSGTLDAKVYLTSVETAICCAIYGKFVDPRRIIKEYPVIKLPKKISVDKPLFIHPPKNGKNIKVFYGPNIKPLPQFSKLEENLTLKVIKKFGDNISTDDILPAGTKILSLRSNIPAISEYIFSRKFPDVIEKIKNYKEKFNSLCIISGENYGQGSSREHAAIVQRFHNIRIIIAKSFSRIHKCNLINYGVLPLTFVNKQDYDKLSEDDEILVKNLISQVKKGVVELVVVNKNFVLKTNLDLTDQEKEIIILGGKLNYIKSKI